MENIACALHPENVVQELYVVFAVPVDWAGTHGDDILTAAGGSLSVHQKLLWILLYHPVPEFLPVAFGVVRSEAELLVKRTDDMSEIWGHPEKTGDFFAAFLEKLCHVLVDSFCNPINPDVPEVLHTILPGDSAINVLN